MNPLAILSGAGMAASGLGMLFNKRKKFGQTEYGQKLRQLSEQGIYSGQTLSGMMGQLGKETGNVAQQAKAGLRGRLISQGMGGSIAGQRSITNIDVQRMDQLKKALKDIQMENERLKAQFGLQYARAATEYDLQNQAQTQGALSDLFGTAGSLLYNQLQPKEENMYQSNPPRGIYQFTQNLPQKPIRPEVPLEPPSNEPAMPPMLPMTLDLSVVGKPRGQSTENIKLLKYLTSKYNKRGTS